LRIRDPDFETSAQHEFIVEAMCNSHNNAYTEGTQMTLDSVMFGELDELAREKSAFVERNVTTSPDVTVSPNLGPWVNRRGLFARETMPDTFNGERIPSKLGILTQGSAFGSPSAGVGGDLRSTANPSQGLQPVRFLFRLQAVGSAWRATAWVRP
jgi:hypothetical protein